jgi:hypothetical protein
MFSVTWELIPAIQCVKLCSMRIIWPPAGSVGGLKLSVQVQQVLASWGKDGRSGSPGTSCFETKVQMALDVNFNKKYFYLFLSSCCSCWRHSRKPNMTPLTPVECTLPNAIPFLYLQYNKINTVHVSRCGLLCVSLVFWGYRNDLQLKDSKLSKISLISLWWTLLMSAMRYATYEC